MASLTHGMNLDDVEALGRYLQQEASRRVLSMVDELDRAVAASSWRGPDADRFRRDWWPKHKANLRQVGDHLHGFGQSALNNATEQERASDEARSTRAMSGGADAAAAAVGSARSGGSAPTAPGANEVGGTTGSLPGAGRTWQQVDAAYRTASGLGGHDFGGPYQYQCTAWAKFRWQELGYKGDLSGALGNGGEMAGNLGGTPTTPVRLGAMASYGSGGYGHVMIVESISADGSSATVSEWNVGRDVENGYADEYRSTTTIVRRGDGWFYGERQLIIANLP